MYIKNCNSEEKSDPGTINLQEKGTQKFIFKILELPISTISRNCNLLRDFAEVDCCLAHYEIPKDEALRRVTNITYKVWIVSAIK